MRGGALGNSFNIGDPIGDVAQDVAPLSYGRINIMIVQQPHSDVIIENPTSLLNVKSPCYDTLGPLLKKVAKSYSPVRNATPKVMALGKDAEWKSQFDNGAIWVPSIITFLDIFIAKSQFYQKWKPLFLRAQEYPDMKDWLDEYEDCLSTEDLWGIMTT